MRRTFVTAVLAGAVLFSGCGKSGDESAKTEPAAPSTPAGRKPDTADGATITGSVKLKGPKPALRMVDMSANAACQKAHPSPVPSEEVVADSNGALANVFIWVKDGVPAGPWAAPSSPAVVDQQGCIYKPHVLGVVLGQPVEFRNSDETNHNIHPLPQQNPEWNESQPPKGTPKTKTFNQEEVMIPVKCNVHPWMRTYIGAVRHPFFAVTGPDGMFRIEGLPPGKYTVEAWHERFGRQEMEITVSAKESKTLDVTFDAKKAGA